MLFRSRDHAFTYPTSDGVIDTIAWQGFRAGVDDVRYVTTLENLIAEQKSSAYGVRARTLRAAERYLQHLKVENTNDLDVVRQTVIDYIVRLLPANARGAKPAASVVPRLTIDLPKSDAK